MSHTAGHGPFARENMRAWIDRAADEIPPGWIDDMVKRLYEEWNRQMIKLETASIKAPHNQDNPKLREQNARTLAALQRQLKEIMRMEQERAAKPSNKASIDPQEAVASLQRRLDQLLERETAQGVSGKSRTEEGSVSQ